MTCRRPEAVDDDEEDAFYEQLPFADVADVLRFVNQECQFLPALTPLQPRYVKEVVDENNLLAVIAGQAMNHRPRGRREGARDDSIRSSG